MRDVLFSRRWMWRHALALAAFCTCVALAYWQLSRAESPTGDLQNWGYALEWPLFAAFVVFAWWRTMRLEARQVAEQHSAGDLDPDLPDEPAPLPATATADTVSHPPAETGDAVAANETSTDIPHGGTPAEGGSARERAEARLNAIAAEPDDDDPRLAEYNRYLARLNADED